MISFVYQERGLHMAGKLIKALALNNEFRVFVVDATEMIREAQARHNSWSTATAALGRTMIGSTLLGATLKGNDKLTVRIDGDGPAGHIVVDSNGRGETKGYIKNPQVSLDLNKHGKIDVRGAVGTKGSMIVTKDLQLKETFSGHVPLVDGELGEDFTYYMATSEQVPSSFGLSVLINPDESVKTAGGFMIQVLPEASEDSIGLIEQRLKELPLISKLMSQGLSPEQLLEKLVGRNNAHIVEEQSVQFLCDCSKERFAQAMVTLGSQEIQEMIEKDHGAEIECHFCRTKYHFTEQDLEELKLEARTV